MKRTRTIAATASANFCVPTVPITTTKKEIERERRERKQRKAAEKVASDFSMIYGAF